MAELGERAGIPAGVLNIITGNPAREIVADVENALQGPLIIAKIEEHISDARSKSTTLLVGGKIYALGGNFFEPKALREPAILALRAKD